jgi:hypothetical protein
MALGALQRAERDSPRWICHVLWAGDSRVYAFTPQGMHQLSIDDLRDPGDAMENLRHDSVISNAISADTEFHINHRRVALEAPFFLVCATDGCFGYLPTPMHFEELVLSTLASATSEEDWSARLQARISAVTGDDASMATIAVGAELDALQTLYAPRLAEVSEQYTAPMDALRDEVDRAAQALQELTRRRETDVGERWRRYRAGYEQFLQGGGVPDSAEEDEAPQSRIWNPEKPISTGAAERAQDAPAAGSPSGGPVTMAADGEDAR